MVEKWDTRISAKKNDKHCIYGHDLSGLIQKHYFTEVVYLLMTERLPQKNENEMLNKILIAVVEHGIEVPTAFVPRTVASTGNEMHVAIAAGVLSVGKHHGGAIDDAAKMLSDEMSVSENVHSFLKDKARIPGLGHKIYKEKDPRAELLFEEAKKLKLFNKYSTKIHDVQIALGELKEKSVPINVDGAIAAIMLDLGIPIGFGNAIFVLGRIPGMIAHISEELREGRPYRRLGENT